MYLVTDIWTELSRDPAEFIRTYDEHFDGNPEHFADIVVIDEFDCPDDLYLIFLLEDDDPRMQTLFDLKSDDKVYHLVTEYLKTFRMHAPNLIPATE